MSRKYENTGFICANCGKAVVALTNGSYRNHCPHCLYSLHVDNQPGDRMSGCHGLMKPVELRYDGKKGYRIVHRCARCGIQKINKATLDGGIADSVEAMIHLIKQGGI